jgi:hypothetical protein
MEIPKKHRAPGTSSTLKLALQDEAYLRAQELMIRAHKNAIKNGLYPTDYE